MRLSSSLVFLLAGVGVASAQNLRILPEEIVLRGPHASQQVVVVRMQDGKVVGQVNTAVASADPKVARMVDGRVEAVGDGAATLTATVGGAKATARVRVEHTGRMYTFGFRKHVLPVLTRLGCNSGACHGALAGKGGFKLSLRGFAPHEDHFVLTRQVGGRRIDLARPAHSLMLLKPTLALPHGGGQKLEVDSPEYRLLADWIATGAVGLTDRDPKVLRLEVFPTAALLRPKDTLQLVVRAHYSDGTEQDVTRWAKFGSTEEPVAVVDEDGLVTVQNPGAAAVHVWYDNLVALAPITVPHPGKIDDQVFARAPRHNFIDEHVTNKLRELRIPPSPPCTDHEFIRRVSLDMAGILPTPEEVEAFLKDRGPDKRSRLIDRLLARSETVDYWAYKWSDLLLISSRKLPQPAMRSFYQFVRQSVADDKPWDRFAREILTAKGSSLDNGAANYYVLHRETTDLTEATSVTFMGMSVTCARCHNHPLEKWTQDQYWSLANLFAQVALRNGERGGEVVVGSQPGVDVLHPRRGVPMPPAPLDGPPMETAGDRRAYFADWLTAPDNPFFARAVVNRVWRNFMGRGLVEAEDDLRQTNPPSNPELLDALAADFRRHGHGIKHLMRTIANSAAYQRSSRPLEGNKQDDRYYSRYLLRRLPAEVVLDAYSQVTKVPTRFDQVQVGTSGGTSKTSDYPVGTRALQLPDTQLVSFFLNAFGRPERGQTCSCERTDEASVTQALHLNNGKTLNDKLRDKQSRVTEWVNAEVGDAEAVRRVYLLALSRTPTSEETARFTKIMAEAAADPKTPRREILEDLFWAVLTGREFLFNH